MLSFPVMSRPDSSQGLCSLRQRHQGAYRGARTKCKDITGGLQPLLDAISQGCMAWQTFMNDTLHDQMVPESFYLKLSFVIKLRVRPKAGLGASQSRRSARCVPTWTSNKRLFVREARRSSGTGLNESSADPPGFIICGGTGLR